MINNSRERFLSAMSNVANSVTVVTTNGEAGSHGSTVSSFCSVSADPPTVLICLNQSGSTCDAVEKNGIFCVNVLPESEHEIAKVFAGQRDEDITNRFEVGNWQQEETLAAPVLKNVTAFCCKVTEAVHATSHTIFIGEVTSIQDGSKPPLIYLNRAFCKTAKLTD